MGISSTYPPFNKIYFVLLLFNYSISSITALQIYWVSKKNVYAFGGLWNEIDVADIQNLSFNLSVKG